MRVIWAVDAIGESALLLERAAEFLRQIVARTSTEIEPVSVLEGIRSEAGIEDRLLTDEQALPGLKRSLELLMSEFGDLSGHLLPCRVLGGSSFSAPKRLALYAEQTQSDLILCSTHARTGLSRLIQGSFTEELLKISKVPVATVRVRPFPPPSRMAYWTSFKNESSDYFRRVVQQCQRLGASLTLFHCPEHPIEPLIQGGTTLFSGAQPILHRITSPTLYRLERRGLAWARWADHQGVLCEYVMDESPGRFSSHFLELLQREKSGIAFMEWNASSREVLRKAPCPVWVVR